MNYYACIKPYGEKKTSIVSVALINKKVNDKPVQFNPKNIDDYDPKVTHYYYKRSCLFTCDLDHQHVTLAKCIILRLGGKNNFIFE